jgi:hypothetical protein
MAGLPRRSLFPQRGVGEDDTSPTYRVSASDDAIDNGNHFEMQLGVLG